MGEEPHRLCRHLAVGYEGRADLVPVSRQRPFPANPLKLLGEEAGHG